MNENELVRSALTTAIGALRSALGRRSAATVTVQGRRCCGRRTAPARTYHRGKRPMTKERAHKYATQAVTAALLGVNVAEVGPGGAVFTGKVLPLPGEKVVICNAANMAKRPLHPLAGVLRERSLAEVIDLVAVMVANGNTVPGARLEELLKDFVGVVGVERARTKMASIARKAAGDADRVAVDHEARRRGVNRK